MERRVGNEKSKAGKVLVIDDDEVALQAITDVLELGGFLVHPLVSPIGATQIIATQGISAAVIDLNMPVMRGDRFIALVRSWDRIRDLPIVLISGEASSVVREAASQLPGVAIVTKAQMNELLVPTLKFELLGRTNEAGGNAPLSTARPAQPARSAAQHARQALAAWRDFAARRVPSPTALLTALGELRTEAQMMAASNTSELVSQAISIVERCAPLKQIPSEIDAAITEMLSLLASAEPDKGASFDRSLALTIHRSRLERVRHNIR